MKITKIIIQMSQVTVTSLGKRGRNPYSQVGQKKRKYPKLPHKRVMTNAMLSSIPRSFTPEVKSLTGVLNVTRLFNHPGESQPYPWSFINACTVNQSQAAHSQQMINVPAPGTAAFNRIGSKIRNKQLALRLKIISFAQRDCAVRFLLVMKKQCDNKSVADQTTTDDNNPMFNRGTECLNQGIDDPVPSAYNTINPITQWRDLSNSDQFTILLDKRVMLRQGTTSLNAPVPDGRWDNQTQVDPNPYGAVVTDAVPRYEVYKDYYINLKGTITKFLYTGAAQRSDNYAYCETNGIYLIAATDYIPQGDNDPAVEISGTFRYRFLDY